MNFKKNEKKAKEQENKGGIMYIFVSKKRINKRKKESGKISFGFFFIHLLHRQSSFPLHFSSLLILQLQLYVERRFIKIGSKYSTIWRLKRIGNIKLNSISGQIEFLDTSSGFCIGLNSEERIRRWGLFFWKFIRFLTSFVKEVWENSDFRLVFFEEAFRF